MLAKARAINPVALSMRTGVREIEVSGGNGRVTVDSFREVWLFREVLSAFVAREIKVRYKQAAFGIAWVVVQPIVAALIFAFFLGKLSRIGSEGVPYLLFALTGMVVWGFFSNAVSSGSESLISQQTLLRKLYFPRELLPAAALGVAFVDLVPAFGVLVVVTLLYGHFPSLPWLAFALPLLPLVLFAAATAIALSALNVYYRDVRYTLPFLLQIGLFASPVAYSLSVLPHRWRTLYAVFNPAAGAVDGTRRIFLHAQWPDFAVVGGSLAWSAAALVGAYVLFKRLERGFADRV